MIDTGAALNLIKYQRIAAPSQINNREEINLSGITPKKIATLGSIHAYFAVMKSYFTSLATISPFNRTAY